MAREMLERLYSKAFVDELAAGVDYVAVNPEDGGKTHVRDEVDAALMLYNLFIIGPGMIGRRRHKAGPGISSSSSRQRSLPGSPTFRCRGLLREGAESCQPERHLRRGPAPA
jgi:hypothetical protein